jgi:hypothetical protein
VRAILALMKRLLSLVSVTLLLVGSASYYVGVWLYDRYSGGRFVALAAFLLVVSLSSAFAAYTFAWYRFERKPGRFPSPEFSLTVGPVILLPLYFAVQPPLIPQAEAYHFGQSCSGDMRYSRFLY